MKTLLKLAALGGLAAIAVNLYRRQQRRDVGAESDNRPIDQVADTNSVVTGDPAARQRAPQPQDWRGAQNVLE
jgi:hypothetical protein